MSVDSRPMEEAAKLLASGKDLPTALKNGGPPDLKKRGSARTVFDGRYKLTRYFGPEDRNRPDALDALYRDNDVELFDLQTDPGEREMPPVEGLTWTVDVKGGQAVLD
jgi:arylsulfatase